MNSLEENGNSGENVVVKKKRGRKPKNKPKLLEEKKSPKKRGRKPKCRRPEELLPKIPKKRGRKPKDKYGCLPKKNIIKNINKEEQIILHLPVTSEDLNTNNNNNLFNYNPDISDPLPYDSNHNGNLGSKNAPYPFDLKENKKDNDFEEEMKKPQFFNKIKSPLEYEDTIDDNNLSDNEEYLEIKKIKYQGEQNIIDQNLKENVINIKMKKKNINVKYNITSLKNPKSVLKQEFQDKFSWPERTNISCWWCCHQFDNTPSTLPIKYENDVYNVLGVFCSPECAASWNFNQNISDTIIWERYSLLNMLYINVYKNINLNIKLAPSKELLEKFGGNLSIEEFRKSCVNYGKDFKLIMPPMKTIIHSINEEANVIVKNKVKKFIPIDKERIKKANEQLKLKRKKPLVNKSNTLENCMNLKRY